MNGVGNKFNNNNVRDILIKDNYDIVVVVETHFNVRIKCPPNYYFVGKSKYENTPKPQGGMAVYQKKDSMFYLDILADNFVDLVVLQIKNSDFVLVPIYIPPLDSRFYTKDYFNSLELVIDTFINSKLLIFGDLNSRVGTPPPYAGIIYTENPDSVINQHGRSLLSIMQKYSLHLVNGYSSIDGEQYDSNFTYFKGTKRSQNDICISNDVNNVKSFQISDKSIFSDHCSVNFSLYIEIRPPLSIVKECTKHTLSYDHLDVNNKFRTPINTKKLNIPKLMEKLNTLSIEINELGELHDTNDLSSRLTNGIYDACKRSLHTCKSSILPPNQNCTSKHIMAICDAHFVYS